MPGTQILNLNPLTELQFTEVVQANLNLANPTDRFVYFKVKTTAPRYYCVRPNSGVISPNESAEISVMLQPVESTEALEKERARHKFMIQSAIADSDETAVDEFWKTTNAADIMDSKLKVVFSNLASAKGDNAVHSGDAPSEPNATIQTTARRLVGGSDETRKANESKHDHNQSGRDNKTLFDDEKISLTTQVQELRHKLNAATLHPTQATGITLVQLILVACAAILIGKFGGSVMTNDRRSWLKKRH